MGSDSWLSVVIPTYNGGRFLAEALDSVVREADPGVEVVAVDDGSTDDTLALLERYRSRLPLRVVAREHGGDWVAGTNAGLRLARAPLACLLHQDDRWLAGRLAAVRRALDGSRAPALVLGPAWLIDAEGRRLGQWRCPLRDPGRRRLPGGPAVRSSDLPPDLVVERLLVQNFLAIAAPCFDRAAALEGGGLDEALWYTADWDLWLRLAARGPVRHVPEPRVAFRVHPASQTATRSRDTGAFRRQLETALNRHLGPWEARHPGRSAIGRAARFSVEVNVALAALLHGERPDWGRLFGQAWRLGPAGWPRYVRDSRIAERVWPRLRLGWPGSPPEARGA